MKWLKNLPGRLYAAYALLLFICMMLIMLLPMWLVSLLPAPLDIKYFTTLGRVWVHIYLPLIFCPVRVKGRQYFKSEGPYIIVCNHNSFVDIPATFYAIPDASKSLAKKEMVKTPIFGIMYRVGSVLVDRNDPESRKQSFVDMKEVLQQGVHMLLYPEGTRNKTDDPLKFFYDGAFSLAVETKKPILPTVIFNTRKILPVGKGFYAKPHKIDVHFLPPVEVDGLSMEELKEQVFNTMWDYIKLWQ
ncbi:1-acyl-sn-glycerol-3-phosphate acyltransferase [Chitinophaga sp. ysch24]|uniref:1-acyl-sn-glycerol-3-phosphate acyltransferase n=2 Tax=Chitinophaga tropicalis TaxID=2683588 RepID=A0A7K1UAS1_9BACT|nr:1-acyl-sn-glycerol-3-phosphate acyltransferase [Chitinophaga tropicalis]